MQINLQPNNRRFRHKNKIRSNTQQTRSHQHKTKPLSSPRHPKRYILKPIIRARPKQFFHNMVPLNPQPQHSKLPPNLGRPGLKQIRFHPNQPPNLNNKAKRFHHTRRIPSKPNPRLKLPKK